MSQKEIKRYGVINRLIRKEITGSKAADLIKLSVRQTKRLKAKVKRHGAAGLIHGNRGKPGNRQISVKQRDKIVTLLHKRYFDFVNCVNWCQPPVGIGGIGVSHHLW